MSKLSVKPSQILRVALLCSIPLLSGRHVYSGPPPPPPRSMWTPTWSDEFNGPDGSLPDPKKWTHDIGGKGWGNHELEYYTNRKENARIEKGNLLITAQKESFTSPDGVTRD